MKRNVTKQPKSNSRVDLERRRRLDELIAKQGVAQTATFDHMLGAGSNLWKDDRDFEHFLKAVKAVREEKG